MPKWRNEYRRCDNCRREYRLQREAQSYCSRDCRRQAAYGRERFKNGTRSFRNASGHRSSGKLPKYGFFFTETGSYRATDWIEKLNQAVANEIDQAYWTREKRKWPVDLIGGNRHYTKKPTLVIDPKVRHAILDTERLLEAVPAKLDTST
jgi:hypothetical protein